MKKIVSLLFMLMVATSVFADVDWMTNFSNAQKKAKVEDKFLLINFSGSDWCHWCKVLHNEVLSKDEFKNYAEKHLVLMLADFPQNKVNPSEVAIQNEKLAAQYGVRGFPIIIILSPDNQLVGQTGYRKGGVNAYVDHLKTMIDSYKSSK